MNSDRMTTILGVIAVICAGVITAGVIPQSSPIYAVLIVIGTISGGIFAYFTNKENPFKK